MKAPKHLLNATEMTTSRYGVEVYQIKMLNGFISYSGQIFKQNPLIFMIQDCANQRKAFFILRFYLAAIFLSLIKTEVSTLVKLIKMSKTSL